MYYFALYVSRDIWCPLINVYFLLIYLDTIFMTLFHLQMTRSNFAIMTYKEKKTPITNYQLKYIYSPC